MKSTSGISTIRNAVTKLRNAHISQNVPRLCKSSQSPHVNASWGVAQQKTAPCLKVQDNAGLDRQRDHYLEGCYAGGSSQRPDFENGRGIPSWTVTIEGKLIDVG